MKLQKIGGWLCFDKPSSMSSNSAMVKVRRIFNQKSGYVGTLDPFATGVLPIALGETRKFIQYVLDSEKTYVFSIKFGATTDTLDCDGKIIEQCDTLPSVNEIQNVLINFIGEIEQIPPVYSAIKINGKRACDRVRKGEHVEIQSRNVKIFDLKLLDCDINENNLVDKSIFEVMCSKGTYVRSLARDIAIQLNTLGYVESLRRTKVGFFEIKNAIPLEKIVNMRDTTELVGLLTSFESPLDDIPALKVSHEQITMLQKGLCIEVNASETEKVLIFDDKDEFYGIAAISADGRLSPVRMCSYFI